MLRNGPRHTCRVKRRATWLRYNASEHGREKRKADARRRPDRRIFVGNDYHGNVETAERARQINDHIRARVAEFKEKQRHVAQPG